MWHTGHFLGRNIPPKCDTDSLEEQGWNLGTAKAEGWKVLQGTVIWGEPRALSHLQLNHSTKVSHTYTLGNRQPHRKHDSSVVIE